MVQGEDAIVLNKVLEIFAYKSVHAMMKEVCGTSSENRLLHSPFHRGEFFYSYQEDTLIKQISLVWRKGLYPMPKPLSRTRSYWICLSLVILAVIGYCIYFSIYQTARQNAFQTNAEDLAIMDQAVWSLLHGTLFHQTVCNVLTDTNCYGLSGISRFAIHFEPILFPISLLYVFWADPKTLLIFQTLVVASGAFPAFWLARLRLRAAWAAVPFALLYLLYPAQLYAQTFDFHAETLTAALLLFAIYFLYIRKTIWCFIFIILSLACKEEIAGVVAMLGLWALLLQGRKRVGLGLLALAFCWTGVGLIVVHYSSPVGHSLLASRFSYLGNNVGQVVVNVLTHPISMIKAHVLDASHSQYLRDLLAPAGYLPALAPWILALAAPTLALNLFSSNPGMYSGRFQYNAEIVPILVFAAIESAVLIVWVTRWFLLMVSEGRAVDVQEEIPAASSSARWSREALPALFVKMGVLGLVLCLLLARLYVTTSAYNGYNPVPYSRGFLWPKVTAHNRLASHFLNEIPATASVITQTELGPHLSERQEIYLFPYAVDHADYIFLDTTGFYYPYANYNDFASKAKSIIEGDTYGVVDMDDGYLLLKRGAPPLNVTQALQMIDKNAHGY